MAGRYTHVPRTMQIAVELFVGTERGSFDHVAKNVNTVVHCQFDNVTFLGRYFAHVDG